MRVSTNLTNTKTDNVMASLSAFYRAIGVVVPSNIALRPYDQKDLQFVDYLERSDVKDKLYIANTPVISNYGKLIDIKPEVNGGVGIEIADATQHYYRPSMKNVQSCHAECQMHRGGQLAYLQNPFWKQLTWYTPKQVDAVHPFRTDYSTPANYRNNYLKDASEFVKVEPYVGKNLIATVNIIPMFDIQGKLYFCLSRAYGDAYMQYGSLVNKLLELYPGAGVALISKSLGNWSHAIEERHLPLALKPYYKKLGVGTNTVELYSLPAIANFGHDKCNLYRYPDIARNAYLNVLNNEGKSVTLVAEKLTCSVIIPPNTDMSSLGAYNPSTSLEDIATKLNLELVKNVQTDDIKYISALTEYMRKIIRCAVTGAMVSESLAYKYVLKSGKEVFYAKQLTTEGNCLVYEDAHDLYRLNLQELVLRISLRNQLTPTITIGGGYSSTRSCKEEEVLTYSSRCLASEVSFYASISPGTMSLLATKSSGITHAYNLRDCLRTIVTYNVKELLEDDNAKVIVLSEFMNNRNQLEFRPVLDTSTVRKEWNFVKVLGYYFAYSPGDLRHLCNLVNNFTDDMYLKAVLPDIAQYSAFKMLQRLAKFNKVRDYTTATLQAVRKDVKLVKLNSVRKSTARIYKGVDQDGSLYNYAYSTAVPVETTQITGAPTIADIDGELLEAFAQNEEMVVGGIV